MAAICCGDDCDGNLKCAVGYDGNDYIVVWIMMVI